jgi:hypothetical protein
MIGDIFRVILTTGGIKELFVANIFNFSDIIKYITQLSHIENHKFPI